MKSVLAVLLVAATVGTAAPAYAAPAAKEPVTMTFELVTPSVQYGYGVKVAGRAAAGPTGNAGKVDILFKSIGAEEFTKHKTLNVKDDGTFTGWDTAGYTTDAGYHFPGAWQRGTYQAVYRGNAEREGATATAELGVYDWRLVDVTSPRALWSWEHTCLPDDGSDNCYAFSPKITVDNGPVSVRYEQNCYPEGAERYMSFAFLKNNKSTVRPSPRANEAFRLPQWVERPAVQGSVYGGTILTGLSLTGNLFVRIPYGCWITVDMTQARYEKNVYGEPFPTA
ncbi:hypothetical protein M1L60_23255 [Actinoplanes sp. TRM 88003]|uniref:Uncharacterized protein n=1 Tax=Paractinoplanes aksuensis TaxID=2939490 RepID=A0ABT1DRQ5_9ACTN|nr:hypothetical protein [Actinoplanes aksuensis]MCO8273517.1 hypothetical protein [Actinoplanes aksuensis]